MVTEFANLRLGPNDKPSWHLALILGLQHAILMSSTLVLCMLVASQVTNDARVALQIIQSTMLAIGLGSILMALNTRYLGCGYLAPLLCEPAYLLAAVEAVRTGGLPLLHGMLLLSVVFQFIIATNFHQIRKIFPTEVTGVVVIMIGITLIPSGLLNAAGDQSLSTFIWHPDYIKTALITLGIIVGLTIWGKVLKQYALAIGAICGFLLAYHYGIFTPDQYTRHHPPIFALPDFTHRMAFNLNLVIPFFIAVLSSILKNAGNITTCQKVTDENWIRPDTANIRKGLITNSISNLLAALGGGMANGISSSNVGLSIATNAMSRYIAMSAGALFIIIAFIPKLMLIFIVMPKPVLGAILFYVTSFMLVAGAQITLSRMIDTRKVFIIGFALIAGIGAEFVPASVQASYPGWKLFLSSPLTICTLTAILLNLVFRIGISKRASITVNSSSNLSKTVWDFLKSRGATWGALPDSVRRSAQAINECVEALFQLTLVEKDEIKIQVSFDEYQLITQVSYAGKPLDLNVGLPNKAEIRSDPNALGKLATYLMQKNVDGIKIISTDPKKCTIELQVNQ